MRGFKGFGARAGAMGAVCLAMLFCAGAAQAKTWKVNSTIDPGSGCTPANCTLRAAIGVAKKGDKIDVPAGTYVLDPTIGQLNILTDITINGAGAAKTIINGTKGTLSTQVFLIQIGGALSLNGVTVTGGYSNGDGGDIDNQGNLSITNSTISNGTANSGGGDIASSVNCDTACTIALSIVDSTVSGGSAGSLGGGIENGSNSVGTITGSTITGNTVPNSDGSGGGAIQDTGDGLTITNSTITGNSAPLAGSGGGIYDDDFTGLSLTNDTIAGNTSQTGANLYFNGVTAGGIQNTIVARPQGGGHNCDGDGSGPPSLGNNLEDDGQSVSGAPPSCGFTTTGDLAGENPKLGPLANNGGPTQTMALKAGSPAIDAAFTIKGIITDQRGGPRPQGGAPDIGAYEVGALLDLALSAQGSPNPAPVGQVLVYKLKATNTGPTTDPAFGVQVVDGLPAGVSVKSATVGGGSCTTGSSAVVCKLGTLLHGVSRTVTIQVVPHHIGTLSDTAQVANGALDPNSANNLAHVNTVTDDRPGASTRGANPPDYRGATVHASVNPNNAVTTYYVEFGSTTSYGSKTTGHTASGQSPQGVSLALGGLHPGSLYHYRIVAVNSVGQAVGHDRTFFTPFLPVLHASPTTVHPGGQLHIYGNAGECPAGQTVTLLSKAFSYLHSYQGEGAIYTTVHHHGFFSTTTLIPKNRARGPYAISGLCGQFPSGAAQDARTAGRSSAGPAESPAWSARLILG